MKKLVDLTRRFCLIPGLSGHEDRVRAAIREELAPLATQTDVMGNLWTTFEGDPAKPSVMIFAHMDQLGFVVRKIEADGLLRLERLGGVPERALASQAVLICGTQGDVPGVIGNKSHHVTRQDEKFRVVPHQDVFVDAGFRDANDARGAGVEIGAPVVYHPQFYELARRRIAGTCLDDRVGCAVAVALSDRLGRIGNGPTIHLAFTTQEEFNLRGAQVLAQRLKPDIAIQLDLAVATDTPDTEDLGEVRLGGGPVMSLYSFHGRGTLNGVIPHPGLVRTMTKHAERNEIPLQRSVRTGVLTDLSYVQLVGNGVAAIDMAFPMRYSHSSLEMCDMGDVAQLLTLLEETVIFLPEALMNTDRA